MMDNQRHLFDLPEEITYLNCAYMSPQLKSVTAVGQEAILRKQRPYEVAVDDFFDPVAKLKKAFSELINNDDPARIAIIPAVSYGIANVAKNINWEKGDEIVVVHEQFPSNIYSWKRVAEEHQVKIISIEAKSSSERSNSWNEAILESIHANTKLVSICHVHWADGTVFDLETIRKKTKEVGALLVIDGTQSVGALPFDQAKFQVDALICAGYKFLMGPYSIGLAYYGPAFDDGIPIEENWINRYNSQDFRGLVNYQDAYQPLAGRYSVGEQSNFMLVPMLHRALVQLLDWGTANIQAFAKNLGKDVLAQLRSEGLHIEDDALRAGHLFGISLNDQFDLERFKQQLNEKQVFVSFRGNSIRVSPHVYNRDTDFERLYDVFQAAKR
jgi:selenocysteine lyase/cysteine desulfurase